MRCAGYRGIANRNIPRFPENISGQKTESLVHAIGRTTTPSGARQWERIFMKPSLQKNESIGRQNCVHACWEDESPRLNINNCLRDTHDLSRIVTTLECASSRSALFVIIRHLFKGLKTLLRLLPPRAVLRDASRGERRKIEPRERVGRN
jgi:DNA mismatch repair ATPase MutS